MSTINFQDYINTNFDFPSEDFQVINDQLSFDNLDLMTLIKEHGTPLKLSYLPKISKSIQNVNHWFKESILEQKYNGQHHYCYCLKSNQFKQILDAVTKNNVNLETSSSADIDIVRHLKKEGKIDSNHFIICNGYKQEAYISKIATLINDGQRNCLPVLDNMDELDKYSPLINGSFDIALRIATNEIDDHKIKTSRLGFNKKDIIPYFEKNIKPNKLVNLSMVHFFMNSGMSDTSYFWNEFERCVQIYCELKSDYSPLKYINIGGGFPVKNHLNFDFSYKTIISKMIEVIKRICKQENVDTPSIFTEFGTYTVAQSGITIYKIINQKNQGKDQRWNMIDSSFINTLPDTWGINKKFLLLPINKWSHPIEYSILGGLTCDSDDYYINNDKDGVNVLPQYDKENPLYIGFFNVGAYQENVGGYGGLQHCLIPNPKHIIVDQAENGQLFSRVITEEQSDVDFMRLLGYK